MGMAALVAVLDGSARLAIVWLILAQLIDGIDGPLARRLLPEEATTKFDGYILDLVIDLLGIPIYFILILRIAFLISCVKFTFYRIC